MNNGFTGMAENTLHNLTDDELIDLIANLEPIRDRAERMLVARRETEE